MTGWLAAARAAADRPPPAASVPLALAADDGLVVVGHIDDALGSRLAAAGLPMAAGGAAGGGWRIEPPHEEALAAIADWLLDHGVCRRRRDERLAVGPLEGGAPLASVERGVARALGIATVAIHLVGIADAGSDVWVQQRAFDKATDPGLWDTLVGGQVAAGETAAEALARETREEAGLDLADLIDVRAEPAVLVRRPVPEGYLFERVEVRTARLQRGGEPRNLDGEVAGFARWSPAELARRCAAGALTLEATLIHGAWLERNGHPLEAPP